MQPVNVSRSGVPPVSLAEPTAWGRYVARMPELNLRPDHPDFLDLDWDRPLEDWDTDRLIDLPKGISRHTVRFVSYAQGLYAVKQLPTRPARRDYTVLRELERRAAPAVTAVGLVENRTDDPTEEMSAALITEYAQFAFSFRELLAGGGFGVRRNQLLDAFAFLLVQLHLTGCFWGDCSLSNVLYRYDAHAIETLLVDAETADIKEHLSDGQREEDLAIMEENVAGGMADIAASQGLDLDHADLDLGADISKRYRSLWDELGREWLIAPDQRFKIRERIERLNDLGFDVDEVDLTPVEDGNRLRLKVQIGDRTFHRSRLRDLTGIEALENQAHVILGDLYYYQALNPESTPTMKSLSAIRWRVEVLEPMLARLAKLPGVLDPLQAYCDVLHYRYVSSSNAGFDIGTEAAYEGWLEAGQPGFPLA